jgi:hypothetical protein
MPIVNGRKFPYTDKGKQAAYDAANKSSQPITEVMSEIDGGPMHEPSLNMKSKLKPYKLKQGLT